MKQNFLVKNARKLRQDSTEVEKKLWWRIRNSQLGCKFYRQRVIDKRYIVDFCCPDKMLVIELDGGQHNDNEDDKIRDEYLCGRGYRVLRFWNNEINENINGCIEVVGGYLKG